MATIKKARAMHLEDIMYSLMTAQFSVFGNRMTLALLDARRAPMDTGPLARECRCKIQLANEAN